MTPELQPLGRVFILLGAVLIIAGLFFTLGPKVPSWLGRLPGDILIRKGNSTFYFALTTCILASLALSLIMWILGKNR